MSNKLNELKEILMEIFQFDQADLDFGIYRIMNQKRDEIKDFLDSQLLPQVREAFKQYQATDKARLQKELDELKKRLEEDGVEPEQSKKYQRLKEEINQAVDVQALKNEVYSHLAGFFRRYYSNGDFLSLRRYKEGVYAIPYEGEEVKLHWANADQYYVKTAEHLRDYTFVLPSGRRVHFKLVDATTERDNNKETNGKERRFKLVEDEPLSEENGELFIRFTYLPTENGEKQTDLNTAAAQRILAGPGFDQWRYELAASQPTEKNPNRTLLDKHLNDYTAKNTFDYFIHKDLGGFLRRELDFYIKNEIMFLDDLDTGNEVRLEQYINKIKVVKKIGHKIIAFLEQLENFQKKLWLKKKFVVEANYCMTLDRVPEELYPEIIANQAQVDEWKRLFAIDEINGDLINPGYTEPLTVDFLKANPYMVLDTAFFSQEFKDRLLTTIDNLEESMDGLLVHGENFQALTVLQNRYMILVDCIFIDPPYNTGLGDFLFKDNYQHSTWLSFMYDRLSISKFLLKNNGTVWITLDDGEIANCRLIGEKIYDKQGFIADIAWEKVYSPRMDAKQFSASYDHILVFSKSPTWSPNRMIIEPDLSHFPFSDSNGRRYRSDPLRKWGKNSLRSDRPNLWYPIISPNGIEVYPIKPDGTEGCWRWQKSTVLARYNELDWLDKGNGLQPYLRQYADESISRPVETFWSYEDAGSTHESQEQIKSLLPNCGFSTPKPTKLVEKVQKASMDEKGLILDFFAGSGTTAHAVINLNREDGGNRKYILVEMAEYFDAVMKPRIQKVTYSRDWKDGKPVSRRGTSHMFKYIRLESYEDTLNNLELRRSREQLTILDNHPNIKEDYLLTYMLDMESRGSASLLNLDRFKDPFNYRMKITRYQEAKDCVVDLVETFNYLLGVKVEKLGPREKFAAMPDPEAARPGAVRLRVAGNGAADYTFQSVEGTNPAGEKVLVIWRTLTGNPERDNAALDAYFNRKNYSTRDYEFSRIYVNGDNNLENLKAAADQWKVLLIEEEFKRLMFDVPDVL